MQDQVVDARVWLGFHFRNSVEQGEKLGNHVAGWELKRFFKKRRPLARRSTKPSGPPPGGSLGFSAGGGPRT